MHFINHAVYSRGVLRPQIINTFNTFIIFAWTQARLSKKTLRDSTSMVIRGH